MQGTQKIIDDILSSARLAAKGITEEAVTEVNASLEEVSAELDASCAQALEKIKAEAEALYLGQIKLGELEAGKAMLKARQQCICDVYDGVRDKLLSAPDKQYLAFLQKLITEVCEDGDEVIAAKSDAKRVTADWVKKVSAACKRKLSLSKTQGDFSGGVILRNAKFDRNLTVDEIIADLKERTASETLKKLGL